MAGQRRVAIGGGRGQQAGAEGQAQSCAGPYVGHTRVRHHRSVAVAAAPAACLALEVQCQCPTAPGFLDLSLYLGWQ